MTIMCCAMRRSCNHVCRRPRNSCGLLRKETRFVEIANQVCPDTATFGDFEESEVRIVRIQETIYYIVYRVEIQVKGRRILTRASVLAYELSY